MREEIKKWQLRTIWPQGKIMYIYAVRNDCIFVVSDIYNYERATQDAALPHTS